jgi:hypothetical protein
MLKTLTIVYYKLSNNLGLLPTIFLSEEADNYEKLATSPTSYDPLF